MKKILCLAASLLALNLTPVFGEPVAPTPLTPPTGQRLQTIIQRPGSPQSEAPALTKFDLDFPGGTPKELVAAIEKATGKPLNAIISTDEKSAKAKLPPIKVTAMDVARLFNTLRNNTQKHDRNSNEVISQEGFFTSDEQPTDNSLWTFSVYEKQSGLTKFNLDFPGGTPKELVYDIQKAMGKPLNVIIPDEDADLQLPPLKMNDVVVPQLFTALEFASKKQVKVVTGSYLMPGGGNQESYSTFNSSYGFKTDGQPSDSSVWYFHADKPPMSPEVSSPKICRFYSLSPYLDRGFTVDDITTAIQTGWKMAGEMEPPALNYHKETKLLMAYGEPGKLQTIDDVLKTLPQSSINVHTAKEYDNYIEHLNSQVKELKDKLEAKPAPTGTPPTPAEKSGK